MVSTQGRAFWILDDITPLHQMTDEVQKADAWLFEPRDAYRGEGLRGANFYYYFGQLPENEVKLEILDGSGKVLRTFEGKPGEKVEAAASSGRGRTSPAKVSVKEGLNAFNWNLRLKPPEMPEGVVHWGGMPGPPIVPGTYQARMSSGDWTQTQSFEVKGNPNYPTTTADYQKQYDLLAEIGTEIEGVFDGLTKLRDVKAQAEDLVDRMKKADMADEEVADAAKALTEKLTAVEVKLTQVKSKSGQDPINFPPMIDNQFTTLYGYVAGFDYQPTAGAYQRFEDLKSELSGLMGELNQVMTTDVPAFTQMLTSKNVPPVVIKK